VRFTRFAGFSKLSVASVAPAAIPKGMVDASLGFSISKYNTVV